MGVGYHRQDRHQAADADRRRRTKRSSRTTRSRRTAQATRRSAAASRSSRATRSRPAQRQPDAASGDDMEPDRPDQVLQGRRQLRRRHRTCLPARVANVSGGFQLAPAGGLDKNKYLDDAGVSHSSYDQQQLHRPRTTPAATPSYFAGKHEMKFGGAWRKTPVTRSRSGPQADPRELGWLSDPQGPGGPRLRGDHRSPYVNGFVTDTISLDRLTVIAGIRIDNQASSLSRLSAPAGPASPSCRARAPLRWPALQVQQRHPARRHDLARERCAQDDRARELRDVCLAAAGQRSQVRLTHPVLGTRTTTRSTATATAPPS